MLPRSMQCVPECLMKRCHRRLEDMHFHEEGSVALGTLEEGITTDLWECDLVSWSREATALWHNSWYVRLWRGSLTIVWCIGLVRRLGGQGKGAVALVFEVGQSDGGENRNDCVWAWEVHSHEFGVMIGLATQSVQGMRDVNVQKHG